MRHARRNVQDVAGRERLTGPTVDGRASDVIHARSLLGIDRSRRAGRGLTTNISGCSVRRDADGRRDRAEFLRTAMHFTLASFTDQGNWVSSDGAVRCDQRLSEAQTTVARGNLGMSENFKALGIQRANQLFEQK